DGADGLQPASGALSVPRAPWPWICGHAGGEDARRAVPDAAGGDAAAARLPAAAWADPLAVGGDRDPRRAVGRGGADPGDDRTVADSLRRRRARRRGRRAAAGARTRLRLGRAALARALSAAALIATPRRRPGPR